MHLLAFPIAWQQGWLPIFKVESSLLKWNPQNKALEEINNQLCKLVPLRNKTQMLDLATIISLLTLLPLRIEFRTSCLLGALTNRALEELPWRAHIGSYLHNYRTKHMYHWWQFHGWARLNGSCSQWCTCCCLKACTRGSPQSAVMRAHVLGLIEATMCHYSHTTICLIRCPIPSPTLIYYYFD